MDIRKYVLGILAASFIVVSIFSTSSMVNAQPVTGPLGANGAWGGQEQNIQGSVGLGNRDPREIVASVVRVVLGFLGIIMLGLIIFGIFSAANAGGEEASETARKYIIAGIIGLVIVLASFGIAQFVINNLVNATA